MFFIIKINAVATNAIKISKKEISDLLTEEFNALIEIEKKEGNINE